MPREVQALLVAPGKSRLRETQFGSLGTISGVLRYATGKVKPQILEDLPSSYNFARLIADPVNAGRNAMGKTLRSIAIAIVSLLAVTVPLLAHHGGAAYETDKSVIVKGTVTDYIWSNPHVFVKVDVKDDKGNVAHWIVEAQNPVSMMQIGWSKNTFKVGDEVEIDAMPARNGNPVGFLGSSSPTAPRRRIVINGKQFQP
jgi:Family of unknown function (DUF6152)